MNNNATALRLEASNSSLKTSEGKQSMNTTNTKVKEAIDRLVSSLTESNPNSKMQRFTRRNSDDEKFDIKVPDSIELSVIFNSVKIGESFSNPVKDIGSRKEINKLITYIEDNCKQKEALSFFFKTVFMLTDVNFIYEINQDENVFDITLQSNAFRQAFFMCLIID